MKNPRRQGIREPLGGMWHIGGELIDVVDVVGFSGFGLRRVGGGVAQNAVADALVVALDAPYLQQGFALVAIKHLLGAMNLAGAQSCPIAKEKGNCAGKT